MSTTCEKSKKVWASIHSRLVGSGGSLNQQLDTSSQWLKSRPCLTHRLTCAVCGVNAQVTYLFSALFLFLQTKTVTPHYVSIELGKENPPRYIAAVNGLINHVSVHVLTYILHQFLERKRELRMSNPVINWFSHLILSATSPISNCSVWY